MAGHVGRIDAAGPYPRHLDERSIAERALWILQTNDWNPHTFHKPSLPIYLLAGAFAAGTLGAIARGEIRRVEEVERVTYPWATVPSVVRPARLLFAGLGLAALALAGLAALRATGRPWMLAAAPAVGALSLVHADLSAVYLNVDVPAACFSLAALAFALGILERRPSLADAAAGGALAGLAVACKYNRATAIVPVALALVLAGRGRRALLVALALAAAAAAFVAATPYAVLDVKTFLNTAGGEAFHYATAGHRRHQGAPGWPQLGRYLAGLAADFGPASVLFAAAGAAATAAARPRHALVLLSLPVAHLAFMSQQRVNFVRNVLEVHLLWALLAAVGLAAAARALAAAAARRGLFSRVPGGPRTAAAVGVALVFLASVPWSRVARARDATPDSRRRAAAWLDRHVPSGAVVVVPEEIELDPRSLPPRFRAVSAPYRRLVPPDDPAPTFAILPERWSGRHRPTLRRYREHRRALLAGRRAVVRARFGSGPVRTDRESPVVAGDPALVVLELVPPGAPPGSGGGGAVESGR